MNIFQFLRWIGKIFKWLIAFPKWLITFFIPYTFKWAACTINKIILLPKCFLFYGLDFVLWCMYLPIRFVFWLMDVILGSFNIKPFVVKAEHEFWAYIYGVDKYVHDDLGTGFHFAHYPDSVINMCYACGIPKWQKAPPFPKM